MGGKCNKMKIWCELHWTKKQTIQEMVSQVTSHNGTPHFTILSTNAYFPSLNDIVTFQSAYDFVTLKILRYDA